MGQRAFDYSAPLIAFVDDMRAALKRNEGKGNWRRDSKQTFLRRCREECNELEVEIQNLDRTRVGWRPLEEATWISSKESGHVLRRLEDGSLEISTSTGAMPEGADRDEQLRKIIREAADVANFAMMIADKARVELEGMSEAEFHKVMADDE